ncbi:MAG: hypothetical protein MZU97_23045 [Bacillus subtilis]|nr:hypothetical protein [Bacillus subtilis]
MNRRQLEQAIKKHYQPQIDAVQIELDFDLNRLEPRPVNRRHQLAIPMRFALRTLIVFLLAAFTYVLFQTNGSTPNQVLAETPDIVAFQAVSSTDLLIQVIAQNDPATLAFENFANPANSLSIQPLSAVENELETLNKYLNMIEQFLGDDQALKVQVSASLIPGYSYQIVYQSFSLSGTPVTYTLNYNETQLTESSERNFAFDDDDDDEVVYWAIRANDDSQPNLLFGRQAQRGSATRRFTRYVPSSMPITTSTSVMKQIWKTMKESSSSLSSIKA